MAFVTFAACFGLAAASYSHSYKQHQLSSFVDGLANRDLQIVKTRGDGTTHFTTQQLVVGKGVYDLLTSDILSGLKYSIDDATGKILIRFCDLNLNDTKDSFFEFNLLQFGPTKLFLDVKLDACMQIALDPCELTASFGFNLNQPIVLRPRGHVDVPFFDDLNAPWNNFTLDLNTSILKEWKAPPFFDEDLLTTSAGASFCHSLKIPKVGLVQVPDLVLCVEFQQFKSITNGIQICPVVNASIGTKELVRVEYKTVAKELFKSDCTNPANSGDLGCNCIPIQSKAICEFLMKNADDLANAGSNFNGRNLIQVPALISKVFKGFDKDQSFGLNVNEFVEGLLTSGALLDMDSFTKQFTLADKDNNQILDISEYNSFATTNSETGGAGEVQKSTPRWVIAVSIVAGVVGGAFLTVLGSYIYNKRKYNYKSATESIGTINSKYESFKPV